MKDSIEIIVGCYNQEKWLPQAISSAQNQIKRSRLKLHALPDHLALHVNYSVRIVHDNCGGQGTGASASRNRAIAESTADWILWLDADDMLPSHYLDTMVDWIQQDHRAIYCAPVQFIEGARLELLPFCFLDDESDNPQHKDRIYPMCMSAIFPRQAWVDVKGFDESLFNMNDLDFWVRCQNAGYPIIRANTFMLRRNVPGSLIDLGAAREQEILAQFNAKHGCRLTKKLLPYRVPMTNEL